MQTQRLIKDLLVLLRRKGVALASYWKRASSLTHLEACILRRKRLTLIGRIALMPERITKDGEWKRERDGSIRTGGEEIKGMKESAGENIM